MKSSEPLAHVLARVPLFHALDPVELRLLAAVAQWRQVAARHVIVKQGDPGAHMFAIVRGRVQVISHGLDGRDALLGFMVKGEVFGEVALFDGGVRSASVVAQTPCELVALGQEVFLPFLVQHPGIAVKLLQTLAARLRRLTDRSDDVAFLDVPTRLAKSLLRLAAEVGAVRPSSDAASLRISQSELGALIDATRESVNKCLGLWRTQGIVEQQPGRLLICSLAKLRAIAGV